MDQIIILAGGKGTRMKSDGPKVLCDLRGISLIERLLRNIKPVFSRPAIVVGHCANRVMNKLGMGYLYVHQKEQLGTGHAVWCAKSILEVFDIETMTVIPGDHPFVSAGTLKKLVRLCKKGGAKVALATVKVPDFSGDFESFSHCGRIVRNSEGNVVGIVEEKDATEEQKKICEVNVSYYCFSAEWLWKNIERLNQENKAREYYLTDMVKIAFDEGEKVISFSLRSSHEGLGVNTQEQLAMAETWYSWSVVWAVRNFGRSLYRSLIAEKIGGE